MAAANPFGAFVRYRFKRIGCVRRIKVKVVGRLGRLTWSLAQFKFKFQHCRRHYNVVADALIELFCDVSENITQVAFGVLVHSLPFVYSSLAEYQSKDDYGADIQGVFQSCSPALNNFRYI